MIFSLLLTAFLSKWVQGGPVCPVPEFHSVETSVKVRCLHTCTLGRLEELMIYVPQGLKSALQ